MMVVDGSSEQVADDGGRQERMVMSKGEELATNNDSINIWYNC